MTMRASCIGPLKHGARQKLDRYYNRPFDVFRSYYEFSEDWIPDSWREKLGKSTQMDWGSWLYVCDRKTLEELMGDMTRYVIPIIPAKKGEDEAKRLKPIHVSEIPIQQWYGLLEMEIPS